MDTRHIVSLGVLEEAVTGSGEAESGAIVDEADGGEVMVAGPQLIKMHPDSQRRIDSTTQFLVPQKLQRGVSVGLLALQLSSRQGDRWRAGR